MHTQQTRPSIDCLCVDLQCRERQGLVLLVGLCVGVCADAAVMLVFDAGGVACERSYYLYDMAFLLGWGWLVTKFVPVPVWNLCGRSRGFKNRPQISAPKSGLKFLQWYEFSGDGKPLRICFSPSEIQPFMVPFPAFSSVFFFFFFCSSECARHGSDRTLVVYQVHLYTGIFLTRRDSALL